MNAKEQLTRACCPNVCPNVWESSTSRSRLARVGHFALFWTSTVEWDVKLSLIFIRQSVASPNGAALPATQTNKWLLSLGSEILHFYWRVALLRAQNSSLVSRVYGSMFLAPYGLKLWIFFCGRQYIAVLFTFSSAWRCRLWLRWLVLLQVFFAIRVSSLGLPSVWPVV